MSAHAGHQTVHNRRVGGDRGSVAAEMAVFVVPFLILLGMFIVFCGRAASAVIDVNAAAAAGARSAAHAATPAAARTAAGNAADAMLAGTRWSCTTATDTSMFRRGGAVTVRVTCVIRLDDLGVAGVGATRTANASATEPIDTFRAGT
jgi:Flp pilus assembly protein TadG